MGRKSHKSDAPKRDSAEAKPSFWTTLPGIITGITALITAVAGLLAALGQFPKRDPVVVTPTPPPEKTNVTGGATPAHEVPPTVCNVSGFVYNSDSEPTAGLKNIKLAYVPLSPSNAPPVPITTTGPDGHFSFSCTQIQPDAFPIHLQARYVWPGGSQVIESEDRIFLSGSPDMNLYLSPRQITNLHRLNAEVLRVTSAQLFKNHFTAITNAPAAAIRPKGVVAIPRSVVIPR